MRKQWKWIVVFLLAALLLTAIGIMLHVGKMDKIRHEELRRESMEAEEQGKENTVPETVDVGDQNQEQIQHKEGIQISKLRTNHLENPIGYELDPLTLSWVTSSNSENAVKQIAAQVIIFQGDRVVFDSGKQEDINSLSYTPDLSLDPYTRYEWQVTVWAEDGSFATSEKAYFETAKMEEAWEAEWITSELEDDISPYFRKEFSIDSEIVQARAYVCGLGLYEMEINGSKVGEEYLMPGYHAYDQMLQYQTYDITDMLISGENTVGAIVGNGWYKGRFFPEGGYENIYGDRMSFLCEIRITDRNGNVTVIGTDETWKSAASPIISGNIYDGEVYDASMEQKGWSTSEFDDSNWNGVQLSDEGYERLVARCNPPIHIVEERSPVEVITTPKGEIVLDFGQNITGWVKFHVEQEAGQEVKLSYGEILQDGCFYRDNLRTAKAEYTYISDGNEEEMRPKFTFYGFRYVKVEGIETVNPEDFVACVVTSDLEQTGWIETSNPDVNQLFSNAYWAQKDNFLDIPTDCPQRDERMGWTGDAAIFSSTACQNMDTAAFYRHFMKNLALEQAYNENGAVPLFVPVPKPEGATHPYLNMKGEGISIWGDVATILPWNVYTMYGDKQQLITDYPVMKAWTDYIIEQDKENGDQGLWLTGDKHLGDWLALDQKSDDISNPFGATDLFYTASAFYYQSANLTAKAAEIIGYEEEANYYRERAEKIKSSIQKKYFNSDGTLNIEETQTAYVISLYMQLFQPEWETTQVERLKVLLDQEDVHLTTGFVGTPLLCRVLSDYGLNEYAYTLLLNDDYPSWLYEVKLGATTVWERWNSVLEDGSISETGMNSLNHYAYGSIVDWMYQNMCGLRPVEEEPGYKKAIIAPQPDPWMEWIKMKRDTASGTYEIEWSHQEDGSIYYKITIPFDCEAEVKIPGMESQTLKAGTYEFRSENQ